MVFLTLALPSAVLAVKAPDSKKGMTFEIEKVFEVDFSTDAQGGCKSYKELLTNSYYDAIVALTGALNAIESVSQVTKKSKDHDPIAKKEWLRVRQTYEKVFGVDPWTPAGGLTKDVSPIRSTFRDGPLSSLQMLISLQRLTMSISPASRLQRKTARKSPRSSPYAAKTIG